MSFFDPEKLQSAQKSNLDLLQQISAKVFEGVEQLSQLQFKTLRASSEEQFDSFRKLLAVSTPQGFAELQASLVQPTVQAKRLQEFNSQVYALISGTQSEISKLAERQVEEGTKQVQELMDVIGQNAPAGCEPAVAVLKTALANAGSVYESAQKAAKQAAEVAESSVAAATSAAEQATREAGKKAAGGSK